MQITLVADAALAARGRMTLPRRWIIAPMALLLALLAMEGTDIDRSVSQWFFNAAMQSFPWRNHFLFDTVLHHWAKYAVVLTTATAAAMLMFTWIIPELRPRRMQLLFIVLAMILAPAAVTLLKQVTDRPCPWDLVEFGGSIPYTRLFETRDLPHAAGQCFPAGHASTGFALMAFYFAAFRERRFALARKVLPVAIMAGLLLGAGRIVQGAHFVSHVLWAGLVCWVIMLALHLLLPADDPVPKNTNSA